MTATVQIRNAEAGDEVKFGESLLRIQARCEAHNGRTMCATCKMPEQISKPFHRPGYGDVHTIFYWCFDHGPEELMNVKKDATTSG